MSNCNVVSEKSNLAITDKWSILTEAAELIERLATPAEEHLAVELAARLSEMASQQRVHSDPVASHWQAEGRRLVRLLDGRISLSYAVGVDEDADDEMYSCLVGIPRCRRGRLYPRYPPAA